MFHPAFNGSKTTILQYINTRFWENASSTRLYKNPPDIEEYILYRFFSDHFLICGNPAKHVWQAQKAQVN